MVKNYRGIQVEQTKEAEVPSILVADYMARRLVTFSPDQTIMEVMDLLMQKKISGGPVVNERNELLGMISEGDCLKEVVKGKYNNIPIMSGKVSEHMASNVITISPDANVFDAADMFLNKRRRRFPVIENGKLIGQISQKDIMRAIKNLKSEDWKR
ncbi:CBS domain-containing protein [Reichenbachiella sp. MALMAid0571]|uniref:CBS domain-containing protein n=1 Tax=Reichenbachiella sp. MALMAid0571 TaxID=3143939 RepID=UPI0032DEBC59